MKTITNINSLRKIISQAKAKNKKVGFVPTMGALHEGHLSLLRKCRRENDLAVLSIFVNPTQFAKNEDFGSYPREKIKDVLLAKKEKVDIIFYPSEKEIYPTSFLTFIQVEQLSHVLCGQSRHGHFRGVTTVVAKLLNIVSPDTLYLGQKDAQQCAVIKQMIADLNFPVKVRICPTVREKDGLALSSRNTYLNQKQRREAPTLYRSLRIAGKKIKSKECQPGKMKQLISKLISTQTSGKIDYIECVNADTLKPVKRLRGKILIAVAVRFGQARLIDNIIVKI